MAMTHLSWLQRDCGGSDWATGLAWRCRRLSAPGQGIVAIETREDNEPVRRILARIDEPRAAAALRAERAVVVALGGGCQTPIGALALASDDGGLALIAAVVALDGSRVIRAEERGTILEAEALGSRVGASLRADGADEILGEVRRAQG
jgi:hydroxymethylbilane synthase